MCKRNKKILKKTFGIFFLVCKAYSPTANETKQVFMVFTDARNSYLYANNFRRFHYKLNFQDPFCNFAT